jgi:DNA-binding transcriptional ArsR family regulator
MAVDLELAPKQKRPAGEPCCEPVVYPDVDPGQARRVAGVAKALGDPIRIQLVDVLRKHAGKVCVCELVPLFDISQPTLSHHLKRLREAGIVDSERRGLWAGIENVEWLKGYLEDIPLPDESVDVVLSNCVINLAGDKSKVLAEAARVLRPGGRFAVSDVIADEDMNEATREDMEQWTGCVAGALTRTEFARGLERAGLVDITIDETHRVHEHAGSAIVRARKPEA